MTFTLSKIEVALDDLCQATIFASYTNCQPSTPWRLERKKVTGRKKERRVGYLAARVHAGKESEKKRDEDHDAPFTLTYLGSVVAAGNKKFIYESIVAINLGISLAGSALQPVTSSQAASVIGRLGGLAGRGVTSPRKRESSRLNGKLGGRPRLSKVATPVT